MAEQRVIIEGTYNNAPIPTTPSGTGSGSTPATAGYVQITNGTTQANVVGTSLSVSTGATTAVQTLNLTNPTGSNPGATVDSGSVHANWTGVYMVTGTATGSGLIEFSLDGTTWYSSTVTTTISTPGNFPLYSIGRPSRYARMSLNSAAGTGTVQASMVWA